MKTIITIMFLIIAFSNIAHADVWLDYNMSSKHIGKNYIDIRDDGSTYQREFNESNNGFGVTIDYDEDFQITGGYYRNSEHRDSVYVGAVYTTRNPNFNAHLTIGVVRGYIGASTLPIMVPSVSYTYNDIVKFTTNVFFSTIKGGSALGFRISVKCL